MKRPGLFILLTVGMLVPPVAFAQVSFTGSYSLAESAAEETFESGGLAITYPEDQGDILEYVIPMILQHREMRSRAAQEETSVIREIAVVEEDEVVKAVKGLLSRKELSDSFSANYKVAVAELGSVIDGWESWSGDFSQIHIYNRTTGASFWNEKTKVLDFGETRYSSPGENEMNLAILPPFIAQFGAGVDKLKTDVEDVKGFSWDIGLYALPGLSAKETSDTVAELFPVLANLQHQVALQLGSQWIRNYLVERMLQHEIEVSHFDKSDENRHLIDGLARLYLFGFLNQVEGNRMNVLLPNLIHFPLTMDLPREHIGMVETLDPLEPVPSEVETAANRVLMYGLLKASQQIEGDFLPLQFLKEKGITIPEGGFDRESFAAAIRSLYPHLDETFVGAAKEIAALMRANFLPDESDPASATKKPRNSAVPDSYQKRTFGNLSITSPASLVEAVDFLGPTWEEGLGKTSEILQRRFNRKPVPAIPFGEKDYAGLRRFGIEVEESAVDIWLLQTAVSNNVEQAFFRLFDGNEIEIWFKHDLVESLKRSGDTETFSWNSSTNEVSASFSFTIPEELFRDASVEELLGRYGELKSPVFPIVIVDREVAEGSLEEKVAAIRKGDYVVEKIIAGAEELSPGELTGQFVGRMDERETFFVVVHEVVEGVLIQKVIGSRDRRWFCDGLANWIAMQECDRRFGEGTGQKVMHKMFPPELSDSHADQVNLFAWPALENVDENLAAAKGVEGAHYDFATRAMVEALSERDSDFIAKWIERIRETRWVRTNSGTLIDAYDDLTGGDLKSIVESSPQ